jgi:hypothetical protein
VVQSLFAGICYFLYLHVAHEEIYFLRYLYSPCIFRISIIHLCIDVCIYFIIYFTNLVQQVPRFICFPFTWHEKTREQFTWHEKTREQFIALLRTNPFTQPILSLYPCCFEQHCPDWYVKFHTKHNSQLIDIQTGTITIEHVTYQNRTQYWIF